MNRFKTWSKRIALTLIALLLLIALSLWLFLRASLAQLDGERRVAGLQAEVSITRDANGVPTIAGKDRNDVAYATGFVHAQERYFQMDLLRRNAAGELSELFGARALNADKAHRLHRFRARASQFVAAMPADERQLLERYVAGINDGLNALGARPFEYALLGQVPRPWALEDSLLVVWAMYFDLQGNLEGRELARGWLRAHSSPEQLAFLLPDATEWDATIDQDLQLGAAAPLPATAPAWWGKAGTRDLRRVASLFQPDPTLAVGSNNSVVAGSRSADGGAIVSDDMHLGIMLPNTWYRAVLQYPDAQGAPRRIVGVTLPGAPLVVAGSNGKLAWGFTNSYGDYLDLIEVAARDGQLRLPEGWVKPSVHQEQILVKGAAPETLVVQETALGPVRSVDGKQYVVHWTAHQAGAVNLRARLLEGVASIDEALPLAASLGIPAQNFTAGDAAGHIGWTVAGPLPQRSGVGADSSYPLKAEDPGARWQGLIPAAEHPMVRDPAGGQIWTANSRQLAGPDAARIGDGGFDLGARSKQLRDSLQALGPRTDVAKVYQVMLDDRAVFLSPWRERALRVLQKPGAASGARAEALRLLQTSWSGHASTDSVGYRITRGYLHALYDLLFEGVNGELARLDERASFAGASARWPALLARLIDAQPAAWLPRGYKDWDALQLAALDRVIADLTQDGKPLAQATWGARNTSGIAHPIAGAVPFLKGWLSTPPDQLAGDNHMPRVAGRSFGQSERMSVTPGKEEQGLFAMPGGQSGHPLSPFFLAGHASWAAGKAMPLLPGPSIHTLRLYP
ncbi:penicillin acylase family protein [Massilia sp. TS11]|uniref:penicillin acylase family protein n=1 Tax=Massilia sp. TS11 TaxID=2908003 RepID=UPI001EDAEAF8|nr:penicillin acylase family protein [Massilia sp. TS11]MCG2585665.1 penicillin acylase family protein [Massilia sp. TS11]